MSQQPVEFRKQALQSRQSVARQETLIRLNPSLSWLILCVLYIILAAVVAWGVLGTIPTHVRGEGVLLVKGGTIYSAVAPEGAGRVLAITVVPGDQVEKGQVVAELDPAGLRQEIAVARDYLAQLVARYEILERDAEAETMQRGNLVAEQNRLLLKVIDVEKANLANLAELVDIKRDAQNRGIETRERVVEAMSERFRSEAEIAHSQQRIKQNEIGVAEHRDRWNERLRNLSLRIDEATRALTKLEQSLDHARVVRSPAQGLVTSVQTSVGRIAAAGTPVVTLASLGPGMDALVFMPPQDGKRVKPGMRALVSPSTIKQEEFGSIQGEVTTVSQFPVSKKAMIAILQNPNLVEFFHKAGPPITLRVRLTEDPSTFSGFRWSSSAGPRQKVTPGSIADAKITVRYQSPVSLLLPSLRKLMGE